MPDEGIYDRPGCGMPSYVSVLSLNPNAGVIGDGVESMLLLDLAEEVESKRSSGGEPTEEEEETRSKRGRREKRGRVASMR